MPLQQPFLPPPGLKGPNTQTFLASARFRAAGAHHLFDNSREMLLETREGVRLQGFYSPMPQRDSRGLVLLLHGWEGSARSTYILATAKHLFDCGYEIFRLNLRDHGDTHHLNRGLFFGTLFDEVFEAVQQAAELGQGKAFFVAGFSLGGNYALRIARETVRRRISRLEHVVAVSPVLSPGHATDVIDRTVFYRRYFLRKWKRSLIRKKKLYPDLYNFSQALCRDTILGVTSALLPAYSPYKNPGEYFREYTLSGDAFSSVCVPTTIITSEDDPIIPVRDFYELRLNELVELVVHQYGGHNGFIENYRLCAWYERIMAEIFSRALERGG